MPLALGIGTQLAVNHMGWREPSAASGLWFKKGAGVEAHRQFYKNQ